MKAQRNQNGLIIPLLLMSFGDVITHTTNTSEH